MYEPPIPILSFDERLQRGRRLFSRTIPTIGGYQLRHRDGETARAYGLLCLRGFVVQGSLDPTDSSLSDVFRVLDRIGWSYTVMHVQGFCPRVVREFISNMTIHNARPLIRGHLFRFSPSVINSLMMTPNVPHSYAWSSVNLKEAITFLTGGKSSEWTGFTIIAMHDPLQTLYRICELNWLPGPDSDAMIKNRLRILYALANHKPVDFGQLVYDQVIDMVRFTYRDTKLIFPNLIYQS